MSLWARRVRPITETRSGDMILGLLVLFIFVAAAIGLAANIAEDL